MNVSKGTIARTIVLTLALFNQALAILGKGTLDITEDQIYQLVTLVVTIVAAARAWWKNNSFSQHAIEADEILAEIRGLDEEVEEDDTDPEL